MKIAVGCDEAAFYLKEAIKAYVIKLGHEVEDYGVFTTDPVLYPDIAYKVATAVAIGSHERGILLCGTGIGINENGGLCEDSRRRTRNRR